MYEIGKIFNDRSKNEKQKRDKLKSRSLIFIDPYGNQTMNEYWNHELINDIIRKYKKDYVPKYLQSWIQIGTMKENIISSLKICELKSNVSYYVNGYQFITYGEVIVWINTNETFRLEQFKLPVLLLDNMEKVKLKIKHHLRIPDLELKLWKISENTIVNEKIWNEDTMLKSEDTILSCELYQDDYIIMAKVSSNIFFLLISYDFFKD